MSSVTVSLVTFNSERYLRDFCESLRAQSYRAWRLCVVDNNSSDQSVPLVREYFPDATIIRQKENLGFARAHNQNIRWSPGDYVLVVNPDVVMEKECIERLVHALDAKEEVASAGGKLLYWDAGKHLKTSRIDSFGLQIFRSLRVVDRDQGLDDFVARPEYVFGHSGALVLYRRKALESVAHPRGASVEYFDEDFFAYKEDSDLAWRCLVAGWKHYFVPTAVAYHCRSVSGVSASRKERKSRRAINRYSYRNHLLMVYKNHFWPLTLLHFFPIMWFESRKFLYLLFLDRSSIAGLFEALRLMPAFRRKRLHVQSTRHIRTEELAQWLT